MARLAFALFFAIGVLSASTNGYQFQSAKRYVSRIIQKASNFVTKPKDSIPYPTEDSTVPFVCERDGLFTNPSDCGSYIRCYNGVYYILPCANDQHFNNATLECEEPCDARCDRSIACECGWDSCTTSEAFTTQPTEDTSEKLFTSRKLRFTCSKDGLYPNPMDCTMYIQCSNGQSYIMPCPAGLHFSAETKRCESPYVAQCDPTIRKKTQSVSQSVQDFTCIKDGLYRNPEDCSTYIQCSNGQSYVMPCSKGLHFSEETERCEVPCDARCDLSLAEQCGWHETTTPENDIDVCSLPPYRGPCDAYVTRYYFDRNEGTCKKFVYGGCRGNGNNFKTERTCSMKCLRRDIIVKQTEPEFVCPSDGLFRNPEECTTYIQCSNGQSYVMPCPRGLHFSEDTRKCEKPCDANCDPSINVEWCYYWGEDNKKSVKSPKFSKFAVTPSESTCVKDGLYPNPKNCSTYIQCSNGKVNVMHCPENLHFSLDTQRCESPCDARCEPAIAKECGWDSRDYEYAVIKQDFRCIKDGLYSNPEDCITYTQCSNGRRYVMSCPSGKHFSRETRSCESICNAHCDESLADECGWEEGEYTVKKPQYDNLCEKDGLYRNPEDCATYIQCSNGQAYVMPCQKGLHFSEMSLRCEDPCDAHCDPALGDECGWEKKSYSLKQPVFDFTCLRNGLFENHADCGTFIQCTGGSAYLISCTYGLHFNPVTEKCEAPCQARCDPNFEEQCKEDSSFKSYPKLSRKKSLKQPLYHDYTCTDDGLYPDTQDCTKYIQCSNGHSYVMDCPNGLHFGQETQTCEPPCDAHCDPTIANRCGWDLKVLSTDSDHEQVVTDESRMVDDFNCIKDGLYRNPEDCGTYYQCSNGRAYLMPCTRGLHYSEESNRCESPCDAHCNETLACECDWQECSRKLSTTEEIDCEMRPDEGPCTGSVSRYYYDVNSGRCRLFVYGGCGGNTNNFQTERECREKCEPMMLGGYRCPAYTGKFGHSPDCLSYYECKRGLPTLKRCPKGTAFDHKKSKCVTEYQATCVYQCHEPDAVYPYDQDCRKYIDCVNGVSKVGKCPPGTAFDPTERDCVETENDSCPWQ